TNDINWSWSEVEIEVNGQDNGVKLECRAESPSMPYLSPTGAHQYLTVYYVPEAHMRLSRVKAGGEVIGMDENSVRDAAFLEGEAIKLTCDAIANPSPYNFTFMFN
ncbi:unnamed protein product, partial [Meganyctiphanes norvegica]